MMRKAQGPRCLVDPRACDACIEHVATLTPLPDGDIEQPFNWRNYAADARI
eukprot:gene1527-2637_t